jgi:hypothetical protein
VAYLEEIKKNDINNATQLLCNTNGSRMTGLDHIYEEGRRQVIFQNDTATKAVSKQAEYNNRRNYALKRQGISTPDQDCTLIQLHSKYALRSEDVLNLFFTNVQEDPSNSCKYLKDFDAFYFKHKPRYSSLVIRQLLFGP